MTNVQTKRFQEISFYTGPNAIPGIRFRTAGRELGVTETPLGARMLVRVGPAQRRKILPGSQGIVILAIDATPGKPYPSSLA